MKVAIVHYWLVGMRGGEKVVEALCELYPEADIFTHVLVPDRISQKILSHKITTSFVSRLPRAAKWYQTYLPLMPVALEELDLRGYDMVLSSESGPAKGIIPPPDALHICYCHSPMRYIWHMYPDYREAAGLVVRLSMPLLTHYLRWWDVTSSARVDQFVANSNCVAARIRKYYRREAEVIYPPVAVDDFSPVSPDKIGDFYLMVGELVGYKRAELAVEAFNRSKRSLVVIGGGSQLNEIKEKAGPTVEVLGPQPFDRLRSYYARCRALIFPGEEDFGIVPVEAMASGRPVIAFGKGGALDSVVDGRTGLYFEEQSIDSLNAAVDRFEQLSFDPEAIRAHAESFSKERFKCSMNDLIEAKIAEHQQRSRQRALRTQSMVSDTRLTAS